MDIMDFPRILLIISDTRLENNGYLLNGKIEPFTCSYNTNWLSALNYLLRVVCSVTQSKTKFCC